MTFTTVHNALPAVGDLRLVHQTQSQLRLALTKHLPTTTTTTIPIDTTVIVLRQLYAHVLRFPLRFPTTAPRHINTREEASCALLRFLWADFSCDVPAAQSFLKHTIVQQLQPLQHTTSSILSSALLLNTLWQRPEFRLHDPICVVRAPGTPLWKHAPCDLPLHQILTFDGRGDVGQLLSRKWIRSVVRPDNKFQVQHLFGRPMVMVVSYKALARKTLNEVKRVVFVAKYMRRTGDDQRPTMQQGQLDYRLIALVRCAQGDKKDSVRLYSQDGEKTWGDGEEWEMGDTPGAQYLLYYGIALAEISERAIEIHNKIERDRKAVEEERLREKAVADARLRAVALGEVKPWEEEEEESNEELKCEDVKAEEAVPAEKHARESDLDDSDGEADAESEADTDADAGSEPDADAQADTEAGPEPESRVHGGRVTRSRASKRRRVSYKE